MCMYRGMSSFVMYNRHSREALSKAFKIFKDLDDPDVISDINREVSFYLKHQIYEYR
jgi:hypothetical protein